MKVLALDLGGTMIKSAIVDAEGRLSKEIEVHKSQMSIVEKNIVQKSEKQAKWLAFSI